MPQALALPEDKSWRVPINMASLHRVTTACSILVSQDSQSADPNRTEKVHAPMYPSFSGAVVPQDLALPEGKSRREPIYMTSLYRVVLTACSILVSQDSQSAHRIGRRMLPVRAGRSTSGKKAEKIATEVDGMG